MADTGRVEPQPDPNVVEPGATNPPQPSQPTDADERGVPYKNVAAEYKRKLEEQTELNKQYQTLLGTRYAQTQSPPTQPAPPKPASPEDDVLSQYSDQDRRAIEIIATRIAQKEAERTGYRFVQQAVHQNELADNTELVEEARRQYAAFKQNPVWASADDLLVQDRALAEAQRVLSTKNRQVASQQAVTDANRQAAANATLPNTNPNAAPPPTDREDFIKKWKEQPENRKMFHMFHRGIDINSSEGQKLLQEYAEEAWNPTVYSGTSAVGAAYRALSAQQENAK